MAICGIYKITNKITNKCYVGQSIDIFNRFKQHQVDTFNEWHQQLNKHPENFIFEILEICEQSLLDEREIYWINYYNSYHNGYNETQGNYSKIIIKDTNKESFIYNYKWCEESLQKILETDSCQSTLKNIMLFEKRQYNNNELCIYQYAVDKNSYCGKNVEFYPITFLQYIDNGKFMAALPFTILVFSKKPVLEITEQINYFRSDCEAVNFFCRPFFIITPRANKKGFECNCFYRDEIGYDNFMHLCYHYIEL